MPHLWAALLFLHGGGTLTIKRVSVRVPEGEEDVLFVSDPTDPLGSCVCRARVVETQGAGLEVSQVTNYNWDAIEKQWDKGNDAGEGFSVGAETDSPREAAQRDGLSYRDGHRGAVLAQDTTGQYLAIYDANGPWAVYVKP